MRFATSALALVSAAAAVALGAGGCRTAGGAGPSPGAGAVAAVAVGGAETRAQTRLPNGITVVVEENHAAPVVAVQVWVAHGSADDPPGFGGAAHLFEHLLLAGSKRRPAGAARDIDDVGGAVGAWTGPDETVYHAAVASPSFDLAIDALGDAVTAPRLAGEDIERARKLILDEAARANADPSRAASEALLSASFTGGPYSRALFGAETEIAALAPADLAARFAQTYVGSALTVVVVGDVEPRAARAAIARAFAAVPAAGGGASARPASTRAAAAAPAAAAGSPARVVFSRGAVGAPQLALGFRTPVLGPEDAARLDLLAALLARGGSGPGGAGAGAGLLERDLVRDRAVVSSARAFTFCSRAGGLLVVALAPAPRRLEEAARAGAETVLSLAREPAAAAELDEARAALEADLARAEAGVEGHARRLGYAVAVAGDIDYGTRYRARLRTLTAADLQTAAASLLRPESLAVSVVLPAGSPAGRDETEPVLRGRLEAAVAALERAGARAPAVPHPPAGTERGDLVRFAAPGGPRLVVLRDTSAPLVTIEAAWAGGAAAEPAAQSGRAVAIAALLGAGTRRRPAADIARELRATGGTLQGFSTATALGLRAEVLPGALDRGLALFADCLLRPSFPEADLEAERRALLERARGEAQAPGAAPRAALRAFSETLWPRQPFHFEPNGGTPEAIAALTRVRLLDHYRRRYPLSRLAVAVVGDVDPARVAAALAPLFATEATPPPERATEAAPPTGAGAGDAAAATTVFRTAPGADEAYAVIGYPGPPVGDADRVALELLAEVLAPRAAAITASPGEPGYFAVQLAASPAHLDDTVQATRALLARAAADGVTAEELAGAARRLIGRHAARLRSKAAIADALALDEAFDLDPLAYREYPAAVSRVRPADVSRAARRVLDPKHEVIAVVRPPESIKPSRDAARQAEPGPARASAEGRR